MPDFRMQQNSFPIASVIDAAQRNNQLQEQARQANQQALVTNLQSIGQIGKSLFDQKVKVAQALAGAHMYANTPEGRRMIGTNNVAQTAQGPVTQNQTAAYDPELGSVTPLKSPVDIRTIATAMQGMTPQDMFQQQVQSRLADNAERELAFKEKYKPQELEIEANKLSLEDRIQLMLAKTKEKEATASAAKVSSDERANLIERKANLIKLLSINPFSPSSNAAAKELKEINAKLSEGGQSSTLPAVGKTVTHASGVKITREK